MRITIVQGAFLPVPPLLGGAVEKVWAGLGRKFVERGHTVTHISRRFPGLPEQEYAHGVQHLRISGFDSPKHLLVLKFLDLLYSFQVWRRLPVADILITNTFWLPILAREASHGKTYVHVGRYPKGQMRFYSRAARLQTVSASIGEAICKEVPQLANRVRVIPYPLIEPKPAQEGASSARKQHILYVGRIHPEKGIHLLLEALARLPDATMVGWSVKIVGPTEVRHGGGGPRYLEELMTLACALGDRVEWMGPVFDADRLARIYQDASIFTYPSLADRGETFGLAPLEAMAHGCAPIVSNLACFRDFIQHGTSGFVFDHTDPAAAQRLASCLQQMMDDALLRQEIGRRAYQTSQDFGLDAIASDFLSDFEVVVGGEKTALQPTNV